MILAAEYMEGLQNPEEWPNLIRGLVHEDTLTMKSKKSLEETRQNTKTSRRLTPERSCTGGHLGYLENTLSNIGELRTNSFVFQKT